MTSNTPTPGADRDVAIVRTLLQVDWIECGRLGAEVAYGTLLSTSDAESAFAAMERRGVTPGPMLPAGFVGEDSPVPAEARDQRQFMIPAAALRELLGPTKFNAVVVRNGELKAAADAAAAREEDMFT